MCQCVTFVNQLKLYITLPNVFVLSRRIQLLVRHRSRVFTNIFAQCFKRIDFVLIFSSPISKDVFFSVRWATLIGWNGSKQLGILWRFQHSSVQDFVEGLVPFFGLLDHNVGFCWTMKCGWNVWDFTHLFLKRRVRPNQMWTLLKWTKVVL